MPWRDKRESDRIDNEKKRNKRSLEIIIIVQILKVYKRTNKSNLRWSYLMRIASRNENPYIFSWIKQTFSYIYFISTKDVNYIIYQSEYCWEIEKKNPKGNAGTVTGLMFLYDYNSLSCLCLIITQKIAHHLIYFPITEPSLFCCLAHTSPNHFYNYLLMMWRSFWKTNK